MIEFADKLWLYLLPVAVVLLLLLFQVDRRGRRANIRRFASERLVQDLLQSYSPTRKRLKNLLLLLGVCFLFLSLARPQWGHTWTESRSRGIDIVFALDTSRSMLARDIKPNRLIRAKLAIEDFVNRLDGDRIGLVAFSGSAFLQCPLTLDYDAFFQSLDAVDTNVISAGGTDLSAAIREAESAFSVENNFKIVVLITDGEDLEESGIAEAARAAEDGLTVYAVGVGTAEGSPIPVRTRTGQIEYVRDSNGQIVQSRLDDTTLTEIADSTGGFYVPLGATGFGLEQVLEAGIGSIPEEEISSELQRTAIERFQWPLGIALFFFAMEPLIGTRRGWRLRPAKRASGAVSMLFALALFTGFPQAVPAQTPEDLSDSEEATPPAENVTDSEAATTVETEPLSRFQRIVQANPLDPVAHYNRGTELYENREYTEATKSFTNALRLFEDITLQADTFYNLGNTRYQEGLQAFAGEPPSTVTEKATTVSGENFQPMQTGQQLLEAAKTQPPPQQQIQQAIGALEQRKKSTEESIESLSSSMAGATTVKSLWQLSINDFESALELTPDHDDARHNLDFVKKQTAGLSAQIAAQKQLQARQEQESNEMDRLIEELKKLLEEQQDQNQENQDQEDPQEDQEQQQNEEQQQDQQNSEQDQQDQQQSGESGEGSEEQENQDPNQQEQQQSADQQEQEPSTEQEERDSSEEEAGESGTEEEQSSEPEETESTDPGEEGSETEESQGEDSQTEESGGEEGDESETMELSEEQANEVADDLAAAAEASGEEAPEGVEGEEVVIGVMSSEDAARLLDSLKKGERKLPFAGSGTEGSPDTNNRQNW